MKSLLLTPAVAASSAVSGTPDRRNSPENTHSPTSAPTASMTPKVVTSKLPILNRVGYTAYCFTYAPGF